MLEVWLWKNSRYVLYSAHRWDPAQWRRHPSLRKLTNKSSRVAPSHNSFLNLDSETILEDIFIIWERMEQNLVIQCWKPMFTIDLIAVFIILFSSLVVQWGRHSWYVSFFFELFLDWQALASGIWVSLSPHTMLIFSVWTNQKTFPVCILKFSYPLPQLSYLHAYIIIIYIYNLFLFYFCGLNVLQRHCVEGLVTHLWWYWEVVGGIFRRWGLVEGA